MNKLVAAKTETIRIATMNEDERKEALLKAGQLKIQKANNRLLKLETKERGDNESDNG